MRLKFFWIPAIDSAASQQELDGFLARHRVVQIARHFRVCPTQPGTLR